MAVYNQVTPEEIFHNEEVKSYIFRGNDCLGAIGFTEHGFAHAKRSSDTAREILASLGYPQRQCQLAAIAGYMHDIGNTVNRVDHAHSGALMAFTILNKLNMPPEEIGLVCSAIGHHDEKTAFPVNPLAAALILSDKSDVRRSRVRKDAVPVSYTHLCREQCRYRDRPQRDHSGSHKRRTHTLPLVCTSFKYPAGAIIPHFSSP